MNGRVPDAMFCGAGKSQKARRFWLAAEVLLLYIIPPLLVWANLATLYEAAAGVGLVVAVLTWRSRGEGMPHFREVVECAALEQWRHVLVRFGVCAVIITFGLALLVPDALFAFPRERPRLWLAVMILYPLVSAFLQEIMYRHLFFRRYAGLAQGNGRHLLILNVLLFAWLHIFLTPLSVVLCIPAGWFFADTYMRSRSLPLAWFEHALYGDFVFTIGLGMYFYHGA